MIVTLTFNSASLLSSDSIGCKHVNYPRIGDGTLGQNLGLYLRRSVDRCCRRNSRLA